MIRAAGILAASFAVLVGASTAEALSLQPVGPSFAQPTYVTSDPGSAGRLFVVEREGRIQLLENGLVTEFADLSAQVQCGGKCEGERGLMSIALAPDFDASGRLFVDYANNTDGTIHIDELIATGPDHESASPATESLLEIPHSESKTHNGGQLQFGPDGDLYVSTGDGGGSDDQYHHAQDPKSPLGKILRVDPQSKAVTTWSSGLRNPFRFSFDRLSGDMVIGDVGQGLREEIDFAPSPAPGAVGGQGANYGWNCREGVLAGLGTPDPECAFAPKTGFDDPIFDYPHTPDPDLGGAGRCAIIGGYVVRDPSLGSLNGNYVYSDLCSGVLRSLRLPASAGGHAGGDCSLGLRLDSPVSFGEGGDGRLYVIEADGTIYRLTGSPPASCPVPLAAPPPLSPATSVELKPTLVGIKAQRRRVERGKRALLTVYVSPCEGRKGNSIELLRNGRPNGTRYLSRACTARFLPRIRGGTSFIAVTRTSREYEAGRSRHLMIRLAHRRRQ